MKFCPQCRSVHSTHVAECPKDHTPLHLIDELPAGAILRGKYEIVSRIGAGGMGEVYRARHVHFDETCAVKLLSLALAHDHQFVTRFRREALLMRKLNHQNAVRVQDIDELDDGRPFLVMEYVPGKSLDDVIRAGGRLHPERALRIGIQICDALAAAHSMGIVHRDIKPGNVLIATDENGNETAKVLDFGIARVRQESSLSGTTLTKAGLVVGTPAYMSPEQAQGFTGEKIDGRSDLYSVGALLYEAFTGRQPFVAETPLQVLMAQVSTPPPHPGSLRADLAPSIAPILLRALEKDPAKRFPTAAEMRSALQAALDEMKSRATPVPANILNDASISTQDTADLETHFSQAPTLPWIPPPVPIKTPAAASKDAAAPTQVVTPTRPQPAPVAQPAAAEIPRPAPPEQHRPLEEPVRRGIPPGIVFLAVVALLATGYFGAMKFFSRPVGDPQQAASTETSPPKTVETPPDPKESPEGKQQQDLISQARTLMAGGNYDGALRKLDQAEQVAATGPFAPEIASERAAIKRAKESSAEAERLKREADLLNEIASFRREDTEAALQKGMAAADRGLALQGFYAAEFRKQKSELMARTQELREEAGRKTIAEEAQQLLRSEKYADARSKARELESRGGKSAELFSAIGAAEQNKKALLDGMFDRAFAQGNSRLLEQLAAEYRKLAYEGGPQSDSARDMADNKIPEAVRRINDRNTRTSATPIGPIPAAKAEPAPRTPPGAPPGTKPPTPEEDAAYREIFTTQPLKAAQRIEMGEAFLQKYPQSSYVAVVNHRLTLDYVATRQEQKAFAAGEKGLAAVNNVVTLAVMCSMMPRLMSLSEQQFISPNDPQRLNLSDPGTPLQLVKSQEYCQRGLRLLDSMKNSVSTSGQSSAPTFDAQRALFHSGLGHLLMRQQQYEPAVRELSAAVDGTGSPAPIDLLMLGVAYENLKKYDESYSAFSRCAKNTSAMQARCAQLRDRVDRLRPPPSLKRKP